MNAPGEILVIFLWCCYSLARPCVGYAWHEVRWHRSIPKKHSFADSPDSLERQK